MDLTPIRPEKTQFNRKYRRLDKPPYTYVAMTTLAIQASPNRRLRLGEILRKIENLKDPERTSKNSKGNYWRVDVELIPEDKLRRQNTSVSRNVDNGYSYASDLNDVFYLKSGRIRRKFDKESLNSMTGIEPVLFQPSDPYSHIQHPFYEEENAPFIQQVLEYLESKPAKSQSPCPKLDLEKNLKRCLFDTAMISATDTVSHGLTPKRHCSSLGSQLGSSLGSIGQPLFPNLFWPGREAMAPMPEMSTLGHLGSFQLNEMAWRHHLGSRLGSLHALNEGK